MLTKIIGFFFLISILGGCATAPTDGGKPVARIPLYWENTIEPHPERAVWSDEVVKLFKKDLAAFSTASDVAKFCPKYKSLEETAQLKFWGELWVSVAYRESGFDPKEASQDVGTATNKDTWSVGLYQMSVVDQKNYGLDFNFTFVDLQQPLPNIHLALAVFKKQIEKRKFIAIPSPNPGLYWAVLRPGGKYDKTDTIKAEVLKRVPACK